uniref:Jacalin-type lectin domain-containing protein n=1 Tax=Oryza punctata TaxID=4537 RepID=A0A0E0MDP7_ORYPU
MQSKPVMVGSFGSKQGREEKMDPVPYKLHKIEVWIDNNENWVNGIVIYGDNEQQRRLSPVTIGNANGTKKILFDLDDDSSDYVVNLYGRIGENSDDAIHCLGVVTYNGREIKLGNDKKGVKFEIPTVDTALVGLFGRSNAAGIKAIGAYLVAPPPTP